MTHAQQVWNRRNALRLGLAGLASPLFAPPLARAGQGPVLVELFTSQGCSDCPPADKLAGELMAQPGVYVVSLNVDYWDYLGWRDTLGQAGFTQRQQAYARARGDNDVYTPQMVINGGAHVVGSNRSAVAAAIGAAQPAGISVSGAVHGDAVTVEVAAGPGAEGTLWLMGVAPEVKVAVARGENTGKSIVYHNVVRHLVSAGRYDGQRQQYRVPRNAVVAADCRHVLGVLQAGEVGRVLGLGLFTLS